MRSEGEIVLIHYQQQPTLFARIESIEADHKKDWYQVTLLFLTLPTQTVTWILREAYIDGEEFTMGGIPVKLEEVKRIVPSSKESKDAGLSKEDGKGGRVIPFKRD
ncbi:MAG: hypothetical protein V2J25_03135 [Desulfatiglans sp.]|jgi:hypothetical protein|nr:hypothetical protein [Thermodesulfobacteriota bacterium]MEE4351839.1 hypothetical protein [Desulfatiglans sp.]